MFRGTDPPFVALESPKGSEASDKTPLTFSEWLRTANFGEERVYFAGLGLWLLDAERRCFDRRAYITHFTPLPRPGR